MDKLSKYIAISMAFFTIIYVIQFHTASSEMSIYLVDALGRRVEVPVETCRVISLAPSITEILAELGLLHCVIGADSYSLATEYLNISGVLRNRGVRDVGGYWWTKVKTEEILALNPDLVLADKGAHVQLLQFFESYGIRVFYLNGGSSMSIQEVFEDIYYIGVIFNKTSEARDLIESIERDIDNAKYLIKPYWGIRVLVVIGIWDAIWITGRETFIDDVLREINLVNAAEIEHWGSVSIETIYRWNPDIVVISTHTTDQEAINRSGLGLINKPIIVLNKTEEDIFSRPGPRIRYIPYVLHSVFEKTRDRLYRIEEKTVTITETPILISIFTAVAAASLITGYYIGSRRGGKT